MLEAMQKQTADQLARQNETIKASKMEHERLQKANEDGTTEALK